MNEILEAKLNNLPPEPGVYQFFNDKEKIIYVGKAKNLRNRVRSYFHTSVDSPKTKALVDKICNLELIVTDSEVEALVLENNLIKELKPRYNINLKDDKTFPYIIITNEPYPRIFPTRRIIHDGSKYIGPFTDVKSMKASLRMINQIFKIRSCNYRIDEESIEKKKVKVCLDYHIKKCGGPCEGLVSHAAYNEMVNEAEKALRGKTDDLINDLTKKMEAASANLQFELAAELRDKVDQLRVYSDKQKVVSNDFRDKDIISAVYEDRDAACTIFNVRSGKLVGKRQLNLSMETSEELEGLYSAAIKFYYNEIVEIPAEIIVEVMPSDIETLLEWLRTKTTAGVDFVIPEAETQLSSLLKMCKQNALLQLRDIKLQKLKREENIPHVLSSLKRDLRLRVVPKKIECFDISNLQGTDTVASMVVFENGKPKKSEYRKFIIQSVDGPDDFASMQEVIRRRYTRLKEEGGKLPDLIMVDGGKGQLSSAVEILNEIGFQNYEIIGLAKRLEEIFFPEHSDPQTIPKTSSSLKLLQHVRDEAHRFAITFHRERRSKRTFTSELKEIKGVGQVTVERLLTALGSVENIKNAAKEEISKVIGEAKAEIVYNYFRREDLPVIDDPAPDNIGDDLIEEI
jgi:excinuclease ABC subunit C